MRVLACAPMNSFLFRASAASLLVLAACSSSDDGSAPPDPVKNFDPLPAATPGKLRGVWETKQEQAQGTIEVRIKFTDGFAVAAARCTYTVAGAPPAILAGTSVSLTTTALDAPTGTFTIPAIEFQKQDGQAVCLLKVAGSTYDFKVEDTKLSATGAGVALPQLTKVGD
jgi:hypothetical protein